MGPLEKAIKKIAELNDKKEEFWEDEDSTNASYKVSKLLKIAQTLEEWDEDDIYHPDFESENIQDVWDTSISPENIDTWDSGELPNEYKMEQLSDEDINSIFGLDESGAYAEDPLTGKTHYDLEPDFTMLDEDFEEKSTESPSELESFINQMEAEYGE